MREHLGLVEALELVLLLSDNVATFCRNLGLQSVLELVVLAQQGHVVLAGQQDPDTPGLLAGGLVRLEDLEFVADDGDLKAVYFGCSGHGPLLVVLVVVGLFSAFYDPLFGVRELLLVLGDDLVPLA